MTFVLDRHFTTYLSYISSVKVLDCRKFYILNLILNVNSICQTLTNDHTLKAPVVLL